MPGVRLQSLHRKSQLKWEGVLNENDTIGCCHDCEASLLDHVVVVCCLPIICQAHLSP